MNEERILRDRALRTYMQAARRDAAEEADKSREHAGKMDAYVSGLSNAASPGIGPASTPVTEKPKMPVVCLFKGIRWIATFPADEYVTDGMVVHFFRNGEITAVATSECSWHVGGGNLPGDPNRREFGERVSITEVSHG